MRGVAGLASGSTLVMSFMLPIELAESAMRPGIEAAARAARASRTPWISFFTPEEMLAFASEAGFSKVEHGAPRSTRARSSDPRATGPDREQDHYQSHRYPRHRRVHTFARHKPALSQMISK